MKKNKRNQSKVIANRRAKFDYSLEDTLIAGIALNGAETKALRLGRGQLTGSYVTVKNAPKGGELWLINATISPPPGIKISEHDQTRSRKLLAKRREIDKLIEAKKQGRAIVPLEILTKGRYIKVKIAAGKGKKLYDKRQVLKKREQQRRIDAVLKNH